MKSNRDEFKRRNSQLNEEKSSSIGRKTSAEIICEAKGLLGFGKFKFYVFLIY